MKGVFFMFFFLKSNQMVRIKILKQKYLTGGGLSIKKKPNLQLGGIALVQTDYQC
jgi:hypothetical protein